MLLTTASLVYGHREVDDFVLSSQLKELIKSVNFCENSQRSNLLQILNLPSGSEPERARFSLSRRNFSDMQV